MFKFESQLHCQRLVLGILCGLLPICCVLFGLFGSEIGTNTNLPNWWHSISATYYANSKVWMIGLLILTSFFFLTYKGYDKGDRIHTLISAITSLGVVIFPCWCAGATANTPTGLFQLPTSVSNTLHCTSALILFASFASMILTQFTKGGNKKRNRVYYICGIVIIIFLCNLVLKSILNNLTDIHVPGYWTLINEFFMLEAFAVAWIIKSKAIQLPRSVKTDISTL